MAGCPKCSRDLVLANPHKETVAHPNGFLTFKEMRAGEVLNLPDKWFDGTLDQMPVSYFASLPHADGITPGKNPPGTVGIWPFESARWRMFYAWQVGRYIARTPGRPWVSLVRLHGSIGPVKMTDDEASAFAWEELRKVPRVPDAVMSNTVSRLVWDSNAAKWVPDGRAGGPIEAPYVKWSSALPSGGFLPEGVRVA